MRLFRYTVIVLGLFHHTFCYGQNQHVIDSLTTRLQLVMHDTDKVNTLVNLAWEIKYTAPDSSISLANNALNLAELHDWEQQKADCLDKLATFYFIKSDYHKAKELFALSSKLYEVVQDEIGLFYNLDNLAKVYLEQGDFPKGLDLCIKALERAQRAENEKLISLSLGSIGLVYWNIAELEKALDYTFQSLEIEKKLDNQTRMAAILSNLGLIYGDQGEDDLSLIYFFEALEINRKQKNISYESINLSNIAGIYWNKEEKTTALNYYHQSLKIERQLQSKFGITNLMANIGALHIDFGEYNNAKIYLDSSVIISTAIGAKHELVYQYQKLSQLHDSLANPVKALAAYKQYILYRDSISNEDNTKAQTRTEMKYEYEKAALIEQQTSNDQLRLKTEALRRRDNLQYSIIFISLLLVFGAVLSLGYIKVSPKVAEGLIFFSFLILFEFALVLADPYIELYSMGAPGYKLLFNALLAGLIFPLHAWFEGMLNSRLISVKLKEPT